MLRRHFFAPAAQLGRILLSVLCLAPPVPRGCTLVPLPVRVLDAPRVPTLPHLQHHAQAALLAYSNQLRVNHRATFALWVSIRQALVQLLV